MCCWPSCAPRAGRSSAARTPRPARSTWWTAARAGSARHAGRPGSDRCPSSRFRRPGGRRAVSCDARGGRRRTAAQWPAGCPDALPSSSVRLSAAATPGQTIRTTTKVGCWNGWQRACPWARPRIGTGRTRHGWTRPGRKASARRRPGTSQVTGAPESLRTPGDSRCPQTHATPLPRFLRDMQRAAGPRSSAQAAVDITTMAGQGYSDRLRLIIHHIDDPVVPGPQPQLSPVTSDRLNPRRPGHRLKVMQHVQDGRLRIWGEFPQSLADGGADLDPVGGHPPTPG
jgi:hypothetical protein